MTRISSIVAACGMLAGSLPSQPPSSVGAPAGEAVRFAFEGDLEGRGLQLSGRSSGPVAFVAGLEGRALRLRSAADAATVTFDGDTHAGGVGSSFTVQFWVRTTAASSRRMVLLSHKDYPDNSLASQKTAGWVFYQSGGTWAWNVGSGSRRLTYERDNGEHVPINDGRWHQLAMVFDRDLGQVWLYCDGRNRAIYSLGDAKGVDFTSERPLVAGWPGAQARPVDPVVPAIREGAATLQRLVDAFQALDVGKVAADEFLRLVVEPKRLFEDKVRQRGEELGVDGPAYVAARRERDFGPVSRAESDLMRNPYTVHQAFTFMAAAPLAKIYSLVDGKVVIDADAAARSSARERLYPSDFDLDELTLWGRALSADEVLAHYRERFEIAMPAAERRVDTITAGVWNIFHGGLHFTVDEHGWDSRIGVARILERQGVDVVMMQETYSAGDFVAAELGYYFATTADWDYLNQGANISVLSRYPIREVRVPPGSPFMNVAARVAVSATQDVWVMSNWYGMNQFADVFSFHQGRFEHAERTPVLFGGDFNAVPHTDGGNSRASKAMLDAGFTDAFRSLYPDVGRFPGFTHRSGNRIDQLYFKGPGLEHTATSVIRQWPTGFPSDHYLIRSVFAWR